MSGVKKGSTALLLTAFLVTLFCSLFLMSSAMDMSGAVADCPFMAHEEVVCPMNLFDHIGAWQSVFLAVLSPLLLLFVGLTVVAIAPHLLVKTVYRYRLKYSCRREQLPANIYRCWQELFARGILHPKVH